jgi:hypothetical protein
MSNIYEGSYLTICALAAESVNGGIYSQRDPLLYSSIPLAKSRNGETVVVQFKTHEEWWYWPSHKRGWIFQERVLSRRMLNFGPYLMWNCRTTTIPEFDIRNNERFNIGSQLFRSLTQPNVTDAAEETAIGVYETWHTQACQQINQIQIDPNLGKSNQIK